MTERGRHSEEEDPIVRFYLDSDATAALFVMLVMMGLTHILNMPGQSNVHAVLSHAWEKHFFEDECKHEKRPSWKTIQEKV